MAKVRDRVDGLENAHRAELGQRFFVEGLDGCITESGIPDREWTAAELAGLWAEGFKVIVFKLKEDADVPGQAC